MTDDEFDKKGRELAEFFGDLDTPFVLVALDQNEETGIDRTHVCSNLPQTLAHQMLMEVAMNAPTNGPSDETLLSN